MDIEKDKAARYRERARQLRAVADDLTDKAAHDVLLATAADYVAMAVEAERAALIGSAGPKTGPPRDI